MIQDDLSTQKCIAGVPGDVFAILPADDQIFLKALDAAGIDLDTIYHHVLGVKR